MGQGQAMGLHRVPSPWGVGKESGSVPIPGAVAPPWKPPRSETPRIQPCSLTVVEVAHVGVVEIGHSLGHGASGTRPRASAASLAASPTPGRACCVSTQPVSAEPGGPSPPPVGHAQATPPAEFRPLCLAVLGYGVLCLDLAGGPRIGPRMRRPFSSGRGSNPREAEPFCPATCPKPGASRVTSLGGS